MSAKQPDLRDTQKDLGFQFMPTLFSSSKGAATRCINRTMFFISDFGGFCCPSSGKKKGKLVLISFVVRLSIAVTIGRSSNTKNIFSHYSSAPKGSFCSAWVLIGERGQRDTKNPGTSLTQQTSCITVLRPRCRTKYLSCFVQSVPHGQLGDPPPSLVYELGHRFQSSN